MSPYCLLDVPLPSSALMPLDPLEIDFNGTAYVIAEDECNASLSDDQDGGFGAGLYREYVDAGRPRQMKKWLRERLRPAFAFAAMPPKWVERAAIWPFLN